MIPALVTPSSSPMRKGVPVLASDCHGNRFVIKAGVAGLLFESQAMWRARPGGAEA